MNQNILQLAAVLLACLAARHCQADPLDFWTWRNPYPTGISLSRLVHANGQFVAVGGLGTIITSPDGTNWIHRYSGTGTSLSDIVWGNGTFVAVGGSASDVNCNITASESAILTSPDGTNWTQRACATTNVLTGVTFGNGQFVAIGGRFSSCWDSVNGYSGSSNTTVVISPDSITWTLSTFPTNSFVPTDITYGRGLFVVVGTTWSGFSECTAAIFTSPDGVNWTQRDFGTNSVDGFSSVAFGNGQFVATGNHYDSLPDHGRYDGTIYTSSDGIDWVQSRVVTGDRLADVVYANDRFTLVGHGYYYIWYFPLWRGWLSVLSSTDGTHWSYYKGPEMPTSYGPEIVSFGGGQYIGATGNQIFTSLDSTNWTEQSFQATGSELRAVAFGNDQFIAVGGRNDPSAHRYVASILTSPRGMSWTERGTTTNSSSLNGAVYGGSQYVAVGENGTILSSSNGFDWATRRVAANEALQSVTYGNGAFVAVGYDYDSASTGLILSSQDAVNWSQQFQQVGDTDDSLYSVAFGNGQFVAVGSHYDSSTSQDTGILLTSSDGTMWTQRYSGTNTLQAVSFGNGTFVVLGSNGEILTSANGVAWGRQEFGINSDYLDFQTVAYGGGSFVVLGVMGTSDMLDMAQVLLTSPDGVNWTLRNSGPWGSAGVSYGASNFVAVGGNRIQESGNLSALNPNPTIFVQPQSQYTLPGGKARFDISADGLPPLRYQWRFNDQSIDGATNVTLIVNSVSATNVGNYSVVVHNGYDSVTSSVAQLSYSWPLTILPTNRTPVAPEITPPVIFPGSYPQQLKTFVNGVLTTNVPPDPSKMTIVLTHGWNSSPDAWATNMANEISLNVSDSPNILVWDWSETAAVDACDSGQFVAAARQTPDQGFALGQALISKLGPTYSNRIHFIGHSLGTLVNGYAAIWIHNRGFAPTNTHLTLLDEAEVATDLGCVDLLKSVLFNEWNPLAPKPYYYRPLPPKFGWADNYITAFGILHPGAHNVILTNGFPANAASLSDLKSQLTDFHGYPCGWYLETVITDVSAMGHRWSFERNGFAGAPSTNTVFLQSFNGSEWNLAQTNYEAGSNYLNARFQKYRDGVAYAIAHRAPDTVQANGTVTGEMLATGPANAFDLFIISLLTRRDAPQSPRFRPFDAQPKDADDGGNGNSGAYAWLPLPIPVDAVSMSFDFRIEGDWQDDSLATALNGTNVLLLASNQVETNVTLNSGLIDVTPYAGKTNELFVGIIGGTSTNALLTLQNVAFYTAAPPSLQAKASGSDLKVSWPLTVQNFNLESTTNLAVTDSWTVVTNVPTVVDLQNTVTNPTSGGERFYRLRK